MDDGVYARFGALCLNNLFLCEDYLADSMNITSFETIAFLLYEMKEEGKCEYDENKGAAYLYLVKQKWTRKYKIGVSKNPNRRLSALQNGNPHDLQMVLTSYTSSPYTIEKKLKKLFNEQKIKGEWFTFIEEQVILIKYIYYIFDEKKEIIPAY